MENYIVNNAANLTPKDVKDVLVAFAAIEAPPQAMVVNAAILQLPAKFVETHPRDLSQLLTVRLPNVQCTYRSLLQTWWPQHCWHLLLAMFATHFLVCLMTAGHVFHWLRCFAPISTLCPLVQALNQIQFAPPPPFVLACGNYLMHRLELFVNAPPGQGQPVDVSVISHIMTALSGFKFDPPAPLLTLVRLLPPVVVACSLACAQVLAMAESIHYVCASTQNSALCVTTVKCAGVQSGADADQVCRSCRHLRPARDICRCVLASQRHVLGRGTHHLCNAVQAQT